MTIESSLQSRFDQSSGHSPFSPNDDGPNAVDSLASPKYAEGAELQSGHDPQAFDIAIIDRRNLVRECLAKSFETACARFSARCFSTIEDWQTASNRYTGVDLILFCCSARDLAVRDREIAAFLKGSRVPVVLVSDEGDAETVQKAINVGIRGIIPTTISLGLAIIAMQLVKAGGIYLPENVLSSSGPKEANTGPLTHNLFTERQAAVVAALSQGKPNKIIAYELNMRESTVKVHVRNIMKKLRAKNWTEVAFLTNNVRNAEFDNKHGNMQI